MKICENIAVFKGVPQNETEAIANCTKQYPKGSYVLREGDKTDCFGVLTKGTLAVINEDYLGNMNYISKISEGSTFAESFAFSEDSALTISAVAETDVEILWINAKKALRTSPALSRNLIIDFAKKNLILNSKIIHMSRRTTKQKLMSYLYSFSKSCGKDEFDIPLNRSRLADYLGIDRSAMCAALSNLQKEGYIAYKKNRFRIIKSDAE